jgi:outer membrane lipoprotein-sorting protein
MKKILTLTLLALGTLGASTGSAMTADELIAKNLDAMGGVEKIRSIQTGVMTGKVIVMGGMELPFKLTEKRNHKMKIESNIQGMDFVQCFDGKTGWSVNPMSGSQDPQEMPEIANKLFKHEADMDGLLVDYEKKGYKVEYVGEDEVEGTPVHHLKLDTGDDITYDMYFDAEYYMLIKRTRTFMMDDAENVEDTYYSDYKDVDGLVLPHAIEERRDGQTNSQIMIETVEFGADVDDGIFAMPAKTEEAAKPEE